MLCARGLRNLMAQHAAIPAPGGSHTTAFKITPYRTRQKLAVDPVAVLRCCVLLRPGHRAPAHAGETSLPAPGMLKMQAAAAASLAPARRQALRPFGVSMHVPPVATLVPRAQSWELRCLRFSSAFHGKHGRRTRAADIAPPASVPKDTSRSSTMWSIARAVQRREAPISQLNHFLELWGEHQRRRRRPSVQVMSAVIIAYNQLRCFALSVQLFKSFPDLTLNVPGYRALLVAARSVGDVQTVVVALRALEDKGHTLNRAEFESLLTAALRAGDSDTVDMALAALDRLPGRNSDVMYRALLEECVEAGAFSRATGALAALIHDLKSDAADGTPMPDLPAFVSAAVKALRRGASQGAEETGQLALAALALTGRRLGQGETLGLLADAGRSGQVALADALVQHDTGHSVLAPAITQELDLGAGAAWGPLKAPPGSDTAAAALDPWPVYTTPASTSPLGACHVAAVATAAIRSQSWPTASCVLQRAADLELPVSSALIDQAAGVLMQHLQLDMGAGRRGGGGPSLLQALHTLRDASEEHLGQNTHEFNVFLAALLRTEVWEGAGGAGCGPQAALEGLFDLGHAAPSAHGAAMVGPHTSAVNMTTLELVAEASTRPQAAAAALAQGGPEHLSPADCLELASYHGLPPSPTLLGHALVSAAAGGDAEGVAAALAQAREGGVTPPPASLRRALRLTSLAGGDTTPLLEELEGGSTAPPRLHLALQEPLAYDTPFESLVARRQGSVG